MTEESDEKAKVPPLGQAVNSPEPTAFCDLVMKGGITSGVIYPRLVAALSSRYRFKNIGGTSAGAIAAGACAAAEYGRRNDNPGAFERLNGLPDELTRKVGPAGESKLFTLFQPAVTMRAHFRVLTEALNAKPSQAVTRIAAGIVRMQWIFAGVVALLGSALLWPFVWALAPAASVLLVAALAAFAVLGTVVVAFSLLKCTRLVTTGIVSAVLLIAALAWLLHFVLDIDSSVRLFSISLAMVVVALLIVTLDFVLVGARFALGLVQGLHGNKYGICSGRTADDSDKKLPALTNWLAMYLNELAKLDDQIPLTFGHLWGTKDPTAPREVNLEVMTSAVSQQMAYEIPFRPGTPSFYYDPEQWADLFPAWIMNWLESKAENSTNSDGREPLPAGAHVVSAGAMPLRALPPRADLPVVVAVRMSLSFPVLLSAVPLYEIDWTLEANLQAQARLREARKQGQAASEDLVATRIWFSDGGISSNMPLHMFDAMLPGHPTFAVNLKSPHPDHPIEEPERSNNDGGRIFLPEGNVEGRVQYWPAPNDRQAIGGLVSFLMSIFGTMQNWRDEIMFPYPGFRDRIVQISQKPDEGGLNLNMPEQYITALANAGGMAAGRLIDRFHPLGAQQGEGWINHQRIRLGNFLGTMQPASAALQPGLASGLWKARLGEIKRYNVPERNLASDFLAQVERLGALSVGKDISLENGAMKPLAEVRTSPRI